MLLVAFKTMESKEKRNEDVIGQGQPTTVANGSSAVNVLTITTSHRSQSAQSMGGNQN